MQQRRSFSSAPISRPRGFTLIELAVVVFIVAVLVIILFPVLSPARHGGKHQQSICPSNEKQIGLALLGYIQDYDEKFPPVVGTWRSERDGVPYSQDWAADQTFPEVSGRAAVNVPGIVSPYVKNAGIFRCPSVDPPRSGPDNRFTYMYNDLAAAVSQADFTRVANTVLVAEGEDRIFNVGHSWEPSAPSQDATAFTLPGKCAAGGGATVRDAPLRHSGGANYCFADGHVKWMKPEVVFFPPRASASSSHRNSVKQAIGPDPQGAMRFRGREYRATFHLR
jgi:prepilin-type processing-associated H-X9-DG protein/prepilin-type N-terminal cleavage/methylation domain-containing protein